MRRYLFFLLLFPLALTAQTKFGYFNYDKVLQHHPQYNVVKADYDSIVRRCEKELLHNENELTRAYVSFLDGQREFPEPILRKRQKDLQELVDKSMVFRVQIKEWLAQVKDSLFAPLTSSLEASAEQVALYNNLSYVINVDGDTYTFINPRFGINIDSAIVTVMNGLDTPLLVPITEASGEAVENSVGASALLHNASEATKIIPDNMDKNAADRSIAECDEENEQRSILPVE